MKSGHDRHNRIYIHSCFYFCFHLCCHMHLYLFNHFHSNFLFTDFLLFKIHCSFFIPLKPFMDQRRQLLLRKLKCIITQTAQRFHEENIR